MPPASYQKKVGDYFFPELVLTVEFFSRGSPVRGFVLELFSERKYLSNQY
jgi:hypothetical protein